MSKQSLLKTEEQKRQYRSMNPAVLVQTQSKVVTKKIIKRKKRVQTLRNLLKDRRAYDEIEKHEITQIALIESLTEMLDIIPDCTTPTAETTKIAFQRLVRLRQNVARALPLTEGIYRTLRNHRSQIEEYRETLRNYMASDISEMHELATCTSALRHAPPYNALAPPSMVNREEVQFRRRKELKKRV